MKVLINPIGRLPMFECFMSDPSDTSSMGDEVYTTVDKSRKITTEGIDITFNTGVSDIKQDIFNAKTQIIKLEKMIETLSAFERNETAPLASKVKAVLAECSRQDLDYTYEISISAYTEIYAYVNIKYDGVVDEKALGNVITETFTNKPHLDYFESGKSGVYIQLKY